jgi:inosine-uridine nucleoside N-ribohydrolase
MTLKTAASTCLALLLLATASHAGEARRKVIIDQDAYGPGGSNLQSILMLVQAPGVEVLGITIESGDGWQKENVAHALRMLELIGRPDIPVFAGATYPLLNSEEETRRWEKLYGKLAYKGAWMDSWPSYNTVNKTHYHAADVVPALEEGEPTTKPAAQPAAAFIAAKLREFPGEVTILALGPFTNLALATHLDEGCAGLARELIIMGFSFNPDISRVDEFSLQFMYNPRGDFNGRWDPEAAKMMLHAGWKKITVIPTDATVDTKFTKEIVGRATDHCDSPASRYVARFAQPGFPMWDEVASAVFLDRSIIKTSSALAMDVEVGHGPTYGATVSWPAGGGPGLGEPDVSVVRTIDVPRLEAMFVEAVRRPPAAP